VTGRGNIVGTAFVEGARVDVSFAPRVVEPPVWSQLVGVRSPVPSASDFLTGQVTMADGRTVFV
jgi:hypothetical protein